MMRIYSHTERVFLDEVYSKTGHALTEPQLAKMVQLVRDNATPDAAVLSLTKQA